MLIILFGVLHDYSVQWNDIRATLEQNKISGHELCKQNSSIKDATVEQ